MKKRILSSLLVGVMTTVVLVGCGDAPNSTEKMTNSQSFGDNCVETSTTSDASADNVSNEELSEADGLVKYSTQVYTPEYSTEENVVYDKKICGTSVVSDDKQSFDLIILDETTCQYVENYINEFYKYSYSYDGTYTKKDNEFIVEYNLSEDYKQTVNLTVDGTEIVLINTETMYVPILNYTGDFSNVDNETDTLTVLPTGDVTAIIDGLEYNGFLYSVYEEKSQMQIFLSHEDIVLESIVSFDLDKHTYKLTDFENKTPNVVKEFNMSGAVGVINVTYFDDDSAKVKLTYDGKDLEFNSYYFTDEFTNVEHINGSTEDFEYSIDLDLNENNGKTTYEGSIRIPLAND